MTAAGPFGESAPRRRCARPRIVPVGTDNERRQERGQGNRRDEADAADQRPYDLLRHQFAPGDPQDAAACHENSSRSGSAAPAYAITRVFTTDAMWSRPIRMPEL